jgi:hypothetical protein
MSNTDGTQGLSVQKRAVLEARLEDGLVQIRLDSNISGVVLPDFLMDRVQVTLNLSYAFRSDVFVIDEIGVRITLSFSGRKFLCVLPWSSLYFMQSLDAQREVVGEADIFIESVPKGILEHYGLTMHVIKDKDVDEIPVTKPIFDYTSDRDLTSEPLEVSELKNWAETLEYIDTKSREHKWPLPLEVIYEVVEELESRGLLDEEGTPPSDQSAHRQTQSSRFELMSKRFQVDEEGEHTPERGIISLKRFQEDRPDEDS